MAITPVELRGGDGVSQIKCIQELVSLNRKMKKLTICRGLYLLFYKKKHILYTRSHQPAQCRTFVPIARLQQTIDLSADLIFALSLLQYIAKKDHNVFPKSSFDDLYSHLYFFKGQRLYQFYLEGAQTPQAGTLATARNIRRHLHLRARAGCRETDAEVGCSSECYNLLNIFL